MDLSTTRLESAKRHIHAAIRAFRAGEIDCAITLAGAAEGQLPATHEPHLFAQLKADAPDIDLNRIINFLKHPRGPDEVVVPQFEAILVIHRAITKFVAVYRKISRGMEEFRLWAIEEGHMPGADRAPWRGVTAAASS
jgi:hypothetical protein